MRHQQARPLTGTTLSISRTILSVFLICIGFSASSATVDLCPPQAWSKSSSDNLSNIIGAVDQFAIYNVDVERPADTDECRYVISTLEYYEITFSYDVDSNIWPQWLWWDSAVVIGGKPEIIPIPGAIFSIPLFEDGELRKVEPFIPDIAFFSFVAPKDVGLLFTSNSDTFLDTYSDMSAVLTAHGKHYFAPVPVPAAVLLLLSAFGAFGAIRLRRRG